MATREGPAEPAGLEEREEEEEEEEDEEMMMDVVRIKRGNATRRGEMTWEKNKKSNYGNTPN